MDTLEVRYIYMGKYFKINCQIGVCEDDKINLVKKYRPISCRKEVGGDIYIQSCVILQNLINLIKRLGHSGTE